MADREADTQLLRIRVPRPLIKITEVFLGDDVRVITSGTSTQHDYLRLEPAASSPFQTRELNTCTTTDEEWSTYHTITDYLCVEELDLAQQMSALGLPLSFRTSKARSNVTSRSTRNGTKPKFASHEKERYNPEVMIFSEMENLVSSTSLQDSTSLHAIEGQVDAPCRDAKKHSRDDLHIDESISISALGSRNEIGKKPVLDEVSDSYSGNLARCEFSPDTTSFQLNADVLGSLSLHGDICPEEILGDACYQALYHHDGDLLNKHDLDRCSDDSSTSCCNLYLNGDAETLQSCVTAESPLCSLGDHRDNFICCDCGDWRVIWDSFYKCNYFVNVETLESTWYPPPGWEKYASSCSNLSREETHVGAAEMNAGSEHSCDFISVVTDLLPENGVDFHFTDEQPVKISAKFEADIDFSHYNTIGNGNSNVQLSLYPSYATDGMKDEKNECNDIDEQKERQQVDMLGSYYEHDRSMPRINENGYAISIPETYASSSVGLNTAHENVAINKIRRVRKYHPQKVQEFTRCLSDSLGKYWLQRYSLFSKFDDGIKMDDESWFSVTPELIAKHHAMRCGAGTIIDCFTGVGGNAIHFAMRSNHVIAIDIDPQKIDYAQHNAVIYGVSERIDFIRGDFFKLAPSLKGDVVFLSPPWGGPDYAKMQTYDIRSLKPREGYYLFKIASAIAAKVVMFLPRNVNLDQLTDLSLSADPPWNLEVEKNCLNGKLKSITAYFDKITLD